jgi:hypothetical protein
LVIFTTPAPTLSYTSMISSWSKAMGFRGVGSFCGVGWVGVGWIMAVGTKVGGGVGVRYSDRPLGREHPSKVVAKTIKMTYFFCT